MHLSRATKARIMRRLNPLALLYGLMAVGGVLLIVYVAMFIALFFGVQVKAHGLSGIFLLTLPLYGFRWWALREGWSAVNIHEATVVNLARQVGIPFALTDTQEDKELLEQRTATLQRAVASKAASLGWLSWRDVIDAANEAGLNVQHVREPWVLGGVGAIARPFHWRRKLLPQAWASVDLDRALPAASGSVTPRARF